jgi:hypothetical protein
MLPMSRSQTPAVAVAERLCRPQRVGVFGHRGVGKTTLLTLLYREAVGGRLPDFRLAAADARTADYLSDKILSLEGGQALPGTLAETDLRFHLYYKGARLDLLFKDYQGEHVELGRCEPIRDFLRDCDAVWLCLDAGGLADSAGRLRREQEVEQVVEDYLAVEAVAALHRPMALVLTKADLLPADAVDIDAFAARHLGMTRHAIQAHAPRRGCFAVSSLGPRWPAALEPHGLDAPLTWLADALQAQDEARLEWLWSAGVKLDVLERCVSGFARRYPDAPAAAQYRQRLRALIGRRRRRRILASVAAAACLMLAAAGYDVLGRRSAERFATEHADDPGAVLANWQTYQHHHPTRALFQPGATHDEEGRLRELAAESRRRECESRLAELRRRGADPDADPEATWQEFVSFRTDYPEADIDADLRALRDTVKARRDEQLAYKSRRAYDDLVSAEQHTSDLPTLLAQADRWLRLYPGNAQEADVRRRRDAYLARLDDRDLEAARAYSAREPLNFQTRRERYQKYLDRHPDGAGRKETEEALRAIDTDWDRHDIRAVRDHFLAKPGDIAELVARCRGYLAVHPQGQFKDAAGELLRWSERVTAPNEYRVTLRKGHFEKSVARFFSLGPDLSVELEVAGVRYGPSNITVNKYDPEWNYEFNRPVRWKLGDKVIIRVTDHDWKDRAVVYIASDDDDPLGMRLLAGEANSGPNRLTFESDFSLPTLPKIE